MDNEEKIAISVVVLLIFCLLGFCVYDMKTTSFKKGRCLALGGVFLYDQDVCVKLEVLK